MHRIKCKTVWEVSTIQDVVVLPTSIGWRSDGRAVFGAGILRQAARRWPQLPEWYGDYCRASSGTVGVVFWTPPTKRWCAALCLLPVRPLMLQKPHLSWLVKAELKMIEEGLATIKGILHTCPPEVRFLTPLLGCLPSDKHKLQPDDVMGVLGALPHPFVVVEAEDA